MRNIDINRSEYPTLVFSEKSLIDMFNFLDRTFRPEQIPMGDLSIAFINRKTMCQLHDGFLNDPEDTDVMTFPGEEDDFCGEICVSVDYAQDSAPQHQNSFAEELTLYLLHGWLHLAGHDDLSDEPRARMRNAEKRIMQAVKEAGVLPFFSLDT
ncbi:MAG: rRNA maturation RNase YbeY [Opitutales bacterium]|nr:rRNA maturation RNase YbeY [Opitutales bacterium]